MFDRLMRFDEGDLMLVAPEDMKEVAHQMSRHLAAGLSDNWNQVIAITIPINPKEIG